MQSATWKNIRPTDTLGTNNVSFARLSTCDEASNSAVKPCPQRVTELDKFAGKPLDDTALDDIREMVRTQAKPMRTTTVKPWYRRRVIGALARHMTARLGGV